MGPHRTTAAQRCSMKRLLVLCVLLFDIGPASAHSGDALGVWWNWDLWVVLPLALAGGLYAQSVHNLWSRAGRGRGIRRSRVLGFGAGWSLLALAVVSPLHALGEQLLTAHMIEHEILMAAAAPLLAFSRPIAALLWALPRGLSRNLVAAARSPAIAAEAFARRVGRAAAWTCHCEGGAAVAAEAFAGLILCPAVRTDQSRPTR